MASCNKLFEKISKLPEIIIAPQVTSPLRYKNTFKDALRLFEKENFDSLFSATEISSHSFEWMLSEKEISPVNYDPYKKIERGGKIIIKKKNKRKWFFLYF